MSDSRQWRSILVCAMLFFLVLMAGYHGEQVQARGGAAIFQELAQQGHLHRSIAAILPVRQTLHRPFGPLAYIDELTQKGATLEQVAREDEQIRERKQQVRSAEEEDNLSPHMRNLLASRSIQLTKYAQFEKARMRQQVAQNAMHLLGKPYVWGGTGPGGFDCSGFTQYVMRQVGVQMPRNSYDQYAVGQSVEKTQLQAGDLVFFSTYAPGPSHMGIYVGDGKFVHALNQNTGVITSTLDNVYYKSHFIGARRVL